MSTLTKLIRPSASLIIAAPIKKASLENGSNYKVLFMKRNAKSSFINAHVYPGGVVDNADHYSNWFSSSKINEKEGQILTNKICAIRETFEESGLLLCNNKNTIGPNELTMWRHKVHEDATQFKVMCEKFNLFPAVDQLIPFSNWITPVFEKKRYDTLFFLTVLDAEEEKHAVSADEKETVRFDWFKPEEALEEHQKGNIVLIPPQWYSLEVLRQVPHYQELKEKAGIDIFRTKTNEIIKILPQGHAVTDEESIKKEGYMTYLAYPGDEVYSSDEYKSQKGNRHRLYFKGRMSSFILERNVDMSNIVLFKQHHL